MLKTFKIKNSIKIHNSKFIILLIFFGIFGLAKGSQAATYYVDFASGADSNNGTATGTALKHCPGDSNYIPSGSAPTALTAGDTVIFKGGVTYVGQVVLKWNGSSGNVITYDGNSAGSWGTGKAIIDLTGQTLYSAFTTNAARSYITINNFEIRNVPPNMTLSPTFKAYGIDLDTHTGHSNITISNSYIHDIGFWNGSVCKSDTCMVSDGIGITQSSYITITGNKFSHVPKAVFFVANSNITTYDISYNEFTSYVSWGILLAPNANNISLASINIHHNTFHDANQNEGWPGTGSNLQGCWQKQTTGTGWVNGVWEAVDSNGFAQVGDQYKFIDGPHNNGIIAFQQAFSGVTYSVNVYDNYFYNSLAYPDICLGSSSIHMEYGVGGWLIYNNIFQNVIASGGAIYNYKKDALGNSGTGTKIFNNTFIWDTYTVNGNTWPPIMMQITEGNTASIDNNIFYQNSSSGFVLDISDAQTSVKNNQFYYVSNSGIGVYGGSFVTYSGFNGLTNVSANQMGNPLFINAANFKTIFTPSNLMLQATSPAIDHGLTKTEFSADYAGTSRPQGSAWDIGAYEYASGGGDTTPPAAPSGLSVQ